MKDYSISRREFLHAAAGAAGASVVGSNLMFAETTPGESGLNAASDRLRFGIIGVGMEGSGLLTTAVLTSRRSQTRDPSTALKASARVWTAAMESAESPLSDAWGHPDADLLTTPRKAVTPLGSLRHRTPSR